MSGDEFVKIMKVVGDDSDFCVMNLGYLFCGGSLMVCDCVLVFCMGVYVV